ncbi:hypothetical protein KIN20_010920 [Parelaphostrongylus tenuis]|uniref:Uncharacterized protein n=1 Tax=Parelaphostrongylus tenuis TaxID=148309 RepID=A0AAD5QKL2_PARTN|nr:hypothetical protein KIN20_010920 [Parelaphostrongylus tenuis]
MGKMGKSDMLQEVKDQPTDAKEEPRMYKLIRAYPVFIFAGICDWYLVSFYGYKQVPFVTRCDGHT